MFFELKNPEFNFGDTFYYVGYRQYEHDIVIFVGEVETIGFDKEGNVFYNNIPREKCFSSYEELLEIGGYYFYTDKDGNEKLKKKYF